MDAMKTVGGELLVPLQQLMKLQLKKISTFLLDGGIVIDTVSKEIMALEFVHEGYRKAEPLTVKLTEDLTLTISRIEGDSYLFGVLPILFIDAIPMMLFGEQKAILLSRENIPVAPRGAGLLLQHYGAEAHNRRISSSKGAASSIYLQDMYCGSGNWDLCSPEVWVANMAYSVVSVFELPRLLLADSKTSYLGGRNQIRSDMVKKTKSFSTLSRKFFKLLVNQLYDKGNHSQIEDKVPEGFEDVYGFVNLSPSHSEEFWNTLARGPIGRLDVTTQGSASSPDKLWEGDAVALLAASQALFETQMAILNIHTYFRLRESEACDIMDVLETSVEIMNPLDEDSMLEAFFKALVVPTRGEKDRQKVGVYLDKIADKIRVAWDNLLSFVRSQCPEEGDEEDDLEQLKPTTRGKTGAVAGAAAVVGRKKKRVVEEEVLQESDDYYHYSGERLRPRKLVTTQEREHSAGRLRDHEYPQQRKGRSFSYY
eukprot:Filipodium_phascolosomae@DN672_c0_g1_i1.p1